MIIYSRTRETLGLLKTVSLTMVFALDAFTMMVMVGAAHAQSGDSPKSAVVKPNAVAGSNYEIAISKALPLTERELPNKGFAVTYKYEFRDEVGVEIEGIGKVPPKGEFSYVTSAKAIVIKPLSGAPAVTLEIKGTRRPEGGMIEIPAEGDFGSATFNETRTATANFFESASRLFNREFLGGYRISQSGGMNCYATAFRPLDGISDKLRAEISVFVSYSTATSTPPIPFRLQYIVRQKPKRSDDWDYSIAGIEKEVRPFITKLLESLKSE